MCIYKLLRLFCFLVNFSGISSFIFLALIFISSVNCRIPSISTDEIFNYNNTVSEELEQVYGAKQKAVHYVGNPSFKFEFGTRHFLNNLAVFPKADATHMHGILGTTLDGKKVFKVAEPFSVNVTKKEKAKLLKDSGGFFANFSDTVSLDRVTPLYESKPCIESLQKINSILPELEDVSVVITMHNEVLSVLLRTLHSILNLSTPALLREIIVVDDFSTLSNLIPGSTLYEYIRYLPKVKIVRLPERRGLVHARLMGFQIARAPIVVVLDSHIEVATGWLEHLLSRLKDSPESLVFPQIYAIDPFDFRFDIASGIGCVISFYWRMQEKSSYPDANVTSVEPISSPTMAGGIFAVRRDWFWKLGGYDEQFSMWGAENVEIGLRTWMCGGKLECMPCSGVYHIFRRSKKYTVKPDSLTKNKARTARIWIPDSFEPVHKLLSLESSEDIGTFDDMDKLKNRLKCKSFEWFLLNVDYKERSYDDVLNTLVLYEIRSDQNKGFCVDSLSHKIGESIGVFYCHEQHGTQSFFYNENNRKFFLATDEDLCITSTLTLKQCSDFKDSYWYVDENQISWTPDDDTTGPLCFDYKKKLIMEPCDKNSFSQSWKITKEFLKLKENE